MKKKFLLLLSFVLVICFCGIVCCGFGALNNGKLNSNIITSSSSQNMGDVLTLKPAAQNNTVGANESPFTQSVMSIEDRTKSYNGEYLPSAYSLRDDYVIYTQNQTQHGLCWAFSSQTAFATSVMKQTGVYSDYSETWAAIGTKYVEVEENTNWGEQIYGLDEYVIGDGGHFIMFNYMASICGLVLESDLPDTELFSASNDNYLYYYNNFSAYADKSIYNNYVPVKFSNYRYDSSSQSKTATINSIKNHVYSHGAVVASVYFSDILNTGSYDYKTPSENVPSGHAITIIGWNDEVSFRYNQTTYNGAWICLNSWGENEENGVFYIFYNDTDFVNDFYGYEFKGDDDDLHLSTQVTMGGYDYTTDLKGEYYGSFNGTNNVTKQKNIFFNSDVDILYTYDISTNTNVTDVSVYYYDLDYTLKFNIEHDPASKTIRLKAQDLSAGAYKVVITYSNQTSSEQYITPIYVCDGNELAEFKIFIKDSDVINPPYVAFNTYNHNLDRLDVAISNTPLNLTVEFVLVTTPYSKISKAEFDGKDVELNFDSIYFNVGAAVTVNLSSLNEPQSFDLVLFGTNGSQRVMQIFVSSVSQDAKTAHIYYSLNGGSQNNNPITVFANSAGVKIQAPSRAGYTFAGWYYDSSLSQALTQNNQDYVIAYANFNFLPDVPNNFYGQESGGQASTIYSKFYKNIGVIRVYAKWTIAPVSSKNITSNVSLVDAGEPFTLTVEYSHDLKDFMTVKSITWFENSSAMPQGELSLSTTISKSEEGTFSYYAVVTLAYKNDTTTFTTDVKQVVVMKTIDEIVYSGGCIFWVSSDKISSFDVNIYKRTLENARAVDELVNHENISNAPDGSNTYNLLNKITASGIYYAEVIGKIVSLGQTFESQSIKSQDVTVYEVSYVTYTSEIPSKFVDEQTAIFNDTSLTRNGYNFNYWATDGSGAQQFTEGSTVSQNTTLYASWSLKDIQNINNIADKNEVYSGDSYSVTINPTHESNLPEQNYEYTWYIKKDEDVYWQVYELSGNTLELTNVNESARFYVSVKLTDDLGLSVTNNSNEFEFNIEKAQLVIDTSSMQKHFTYDATSHEINSGAVLRNPAGSAVEDIEIVYNIVELNDISFIDVPNGGVYNVKVSTQGNDNFLPAETTISISVAKAKSEIVAHSYQFCDYTGDIAQPKYELNNDQQMVQINSDCIDVGEYDVSLVAYESQNYEQSSVDIKLVIRPAKLLIRVNDVTSVLFFKQKALSYTIVDGQVYNDDELGITFIANINTNKIGRYTITLESNNSNYQIASIEGKYSVTCWPYILAVGLLGFIIFIVVDLLKKRRFIYEFDSNGGSALNIIDEKNYKKIKLPTPVREGYKFVGWYYDAALSVPFDNKYKMSKGITLHAKWQKVEKPQDGFDVSKIDKQLLEKQISQALKDNQIAEENKKKEELAKQLQKEKQVKLPKKVDPKQKPEETEEDKMKKLISNVSASGEVNSKDIDDILKKIK